MGAIPVEQTIAIIDAVKHKGWWDILPIVIGSVVALSGALITWFKFFRKRSNGKKTEKKD